MLFFRGHRSFSTLLMIAISFFLLSACAPGAATNSSGGSSSTPTQKTESDYCQTRPSYPSGPTITGTGQYYYRAISPDLGLSGNPVGAVISFAEIQVVNSSGVVVQCSETAANGTFSLKVPSSGTYTLSILSRSNTAALVASVNEDYYENQPYRISKSFTVGSGASSLAIGTLYAYARTSESAKIEGAAFNILSMMWKANEYIRTTTANSAFVAPKVTAYWKKGFNPYTYFGGTSPLSFYRPGTHELFILGGSGGKVHNVDTDHFDNSVILHEYAHFLEDVYAKSDSPGGSHNGNFIIDPRLAWSEGWANFFQAAVLRSYDANWRYYIDTYGYKNDSVENDESGGLSIKVELTMSGSPGNCAASPSNFAAFLCDPVGTDGEGTFREMSISRYLFKSIRAPADNGGDVPFAALWSAFSGGDVSGTPVGLASSQVTFRNVGIFNQFLASILAANYPSVVTGWNNVLGYERQRSSTKEYADNLVRMTNNTCPLTNIAPVVDGTFMTSSRSNLLRSNDFYRFTHDGASKTISLSYTGGSTHMDLDLFLYKEDHYYQESWQGENGTIVARSARPFISENGNESISLAGLPSGTYLINVKAYTLNKTSANLSGQNANYRLKVTQSSTTEDLCPAH